MSDEKAIVEYEASDGQDVKLSPSIVAKYIVSGGQQVDDKEVFRFMAMCQARKLNPLAGDAYMVAYKDRRTGEVKANVIVSKDYYVRTATQQPDYDGYEAGVAVMTQDGRFIKRDGALVLRNEQLMGGWATVYSKERSHPSKSFVSLQEYDQHRSLWKTKPATMIRKVALVQAIREAYPQQFAGVYDKSEMDEPEQAAPQQVEATQEEPEFVPTPEHPAPGVTVIQHGQPEAAAVIPAVLETYPDAQIQEVGSF